VSTEQPQEGGHKKPPIPTPAKKVPAYNIERRGDRLYQVQTLHKWFAISSLLLLVFTIGTVLKDYSREWKQYQRQFNEISVRNTVQDALAVRENTDFTKYSQLQADLNTATEAEKQSSAQINELEEKVAALNARWIRVDQDYRNTKAKYDEEKYAYEEALAHNASNKDKLKEGVDKTGQLIPQDAAGRYQTLQWLMFQMGGIGPMFGQLGFFSKFAGKAYEDKRPRDRYVAEARRLLGVLEQRLAGRAWLMGDAYTIADIATFPWVRNLIGFYEAGELVGFADFPNVGRVLEAFLKRPAVVAGLNIPKRG